jgi:hypothetical protein
MHYSFVRCASSCRSLAAELVLEEVELLTLFLGEHGADCVRVLLALLEELLGHHNGDLFNERIISQEIGLFIEHIHSSVQRTLVGHRQLLSCLHLALDFVLELGHVKHQLVHLARPHGQLLALEVLSEDSLLSVDSLLAPLVAHVSPASKLSLELVSVNGVSRVGRNPLLFSPVLHKLGPVFHANPVVKQTLLHLEEPPQAAHVLLLSFLKLSGHGFLLLHGFNELVNVGLLLVKIDLIIRLVVADVAFFHQVVFVQQFLVEVHEERIINLLEGLHVLVVVGQWDLLPDNGEV